MFQNIWSIELDIQQNAASLIHLSIQGPDEMSILNILHYNNISSKLRCNLILLFVLLTDLADLEAVYHHMYKPSNRSLLAKQSKDAIPIASTSKINRNAKSSILRPQEINQQLARSSISPF
jgi:hypothetical protein